MENFISGYPGCEFQIRAALADVVGPGKAAFFFDKVSCSSRIVPLFSPDSRLSLQFLEYFFQEEDAKFFKSLGLNCIRLPFNYRHFEGDSLIGTSTLEPLSNHLSPQMT